MKRLFKSILSLVLVASLITSVFVIATPVKADITYTRVQTITITDNSSTNRANLPVILSGVVGSYLQGAGYINSAGTDTAITENITDTNINYMMDTTQANVVVPALPSGGSVNYNFYMGTTTNQTRFPIIVGNGGYVTTTDNASLELGNNFTLGFNGYADTTQVGANFANKANAVRMYVANTNNVTANVSLRVNPDSNTPLGWANPTYAYDNSTATYASETVAATTWFDYLTLNNVGVYASSIDFWITVNSAWANQLQIWVYYSGAWNNVFSESPITSIGAWFNVPIGSTENVTGVRIRCYNYDVNPQEARVNELHLSHQQTISVAGLSGGVQTASLSKDSSSLILTVGSSSSTIASEPTYSINNTASDWTFISSNVMPYADNISILVNGTQQLFYQPNAMLTGTTLPDRAGTAQDGTITWGTNTANSLIITYGSIILAPSVLTSGASAIGTTSVIMQGTLTSFGVHSYSGVSFQYGTTTSYGQTTVEQSVTALGTFNTQVTALFYNQTYHFRAVARFDSVYVYGADNYFTTLAAAGSSADLIIVSAKVFSNYLSTGDYLFVAEVINKYTNLYPGEKPGQHFTLQLMDITNTNILGAAPLVNWGDRPVAIYFNPTLASALVDHSQYYIKMIGDNVSGYAAVEYQLQDTDWKGYDLSYLDNWCKGVALNMQVSDSRQDYLVNLTDIGNVIDDPAGSYFSTGIPGVTQSRPNLFATSKQTPEQPTGPAGTDWDTTGPLWDVNVGPIIAADATVMAAPFGINGKDLLAVIIMVSILGFIISVAAFGALGGLLISLPIIWVGSWFKILPIILLILLILFFGFMFLRQFFIKTT